MITELVEISFTLRPEGAEFAEKTIPVRETPKLLVYDTGLGRMTFRKEDLDQIQRGTIADFPYSIYRWGFCVPDQTAEMKAKMMQDAMNVANSMRSDIERMIHHLSPKERNLLDEQGAA